MQLEITETVAAPIERVWAMISDFSAIQTWHPEVLRCEASGVGVGARRAVHFKDWWVEEGLAELDPAGHALAYEVTGGTRTEVIGARSRMSLAPLGPATTQLTWASQLPGEGAAGDALKTSLEAYYRIRVGHLRAALDVE
jgi:mxaD protein